MIATLTRASYCVELNPKQWARLQQLDFFELHAALVRAGMTRNTLEYEGHWGRNVFFSMDVDDNGEIYIGPVLGVLESLLEEP